MTHPDDVFVTTYARKGTPLVTGDGVSVWDEENNHYLDFGAGIAVNALGHNHPELTRALTEQAERLLHVSNLYYSAPQLALARMLVNKSFADKVFFCNSGTEAIEAAIKFARKHAQARDQNAYHVLSFSDGFHGRTYGALSATPQEKFHKGFGPLVPGFHYAPFNDCGATQELLQQYPFCAIIVEPLQGEGGINSADPAFLQLLRDHATAHDETCLIFDEIQCGLGRTGTLWCYEHFGITPDMMALAKPLGGGLPLGALVCTDDVVSGIAPGDHGTTFGGNPVACALGSAMLETIAQKDFLAHVQRMGDLLRGRLADIASRHPDICCDVRGKGLMCGIRMTQDPTTLIDACARNGLLVIKAGHNTVRFLPPLIVAAVHIDNACTIFADALREWTA
jgi:predicted acetylornithine/succinylornithine family transaminase